MKFQSSILLACLLFLSMTVYSFDPLFCTRIDYPAGTGPYSFFNSDPDGDGDIDLAVANCYSDNVSILLNLFIPNYVCAGANSDGSINVADAVYVVNYVFNGRPEPCCP